MVVHRSARADSGKCLTAPSRPTAGRTIAVDTPLFAAFNDAIPTVASVKILVGTLVLAAEHEGITVVEAANVEAVGQFVLQSGMAQWNSVRVTASQTQQDALQELSSMPPPIY